MANTNDAPTLFSLSDEPYSLENPAEDVRNHDVIDRKGEEIGSVDDLLVDEREHKVRFLRVKEGGFLGMGGRYFLVPVDAITRIGDDKVHIDQTGEHVGSGPSYEPDVAADETWRREAVRDDGYYPGVYRHYGVSPFWAPGYAYPGYPFYV